MGNAIIADFLQGGLAGLEHMSEDEVKDDCTSYAKRQDGDFPVILTQLQRQQLKALMLWVKDKVRAQQPIEFPDRFGNAELNDQLADALSRESMRKEQRKVGESYHDHTFNNKLTTGETFILVIHEALWYGTSQKP